MLKMQDGQVNDGRKCTAWKYKDTIVSDKSKKVDNARHVNGRHDINTQESDGQTTCKEFSMAPSVPANATDVRRMTSSR